MSKLTNLVDSRIREVVGPSLERGGLPKATGRAPVPYAFLGDNTAVILTYSGLRMLIDTRDRGLSPLLALLGEWERAIEDVIRRLLRPGARVIEIGANMGYHTLAMAQAIGPDGRIDAFEANPRMHELLWDSICLNGFQDRARAHARAALDRNEKVEFQFDYRYVGGGNIVAGQRDPSNTQIHVEAVRIDDFLTDIHAVDLIRMDAEGSEPLVLKGASRIVDASPDLNIVMEFSPSMMSWRANVAEFVSWLASKGFKAWRIEGDASLTSLEMNSLAEIFHRELVFSRRDVLN